MPLVIAKWPAARGLLSPITALLPSATVDSGLDDRVIVVATGALMSAFAWVNR